MFSLFPILLAAASAPNFGDAFWSHWGDGQAELSGYELTIPRYGELRHGTAVCIFVTEDFSDELRVKADPGRHDAALVYPVLKLNLVQDFQTGIYDYNLMTSAFVALREHAGRPSGSATKVSFSSQEWCGQVYQQALFFADRVDLTSHSYFDGEADQTRSLALDAPVLAEDALLVWARGLAWPLVGAGESVEVPMLRSARTQRLAHQPAAVFEVTLERAAETSTSEWNGETVEVRAATVRDTDGQTLWTFLVEVAAPGRVMEWSRPDGERARLLRSERMQYWTLQHVGDEQLLRGLGLEVPK